MASIELFLPQGDDGKVCVHVIASDGEPIDLAAYTEITFSLKRSIQDPDSEAIFLGTFTGGNIKISAPSEDGICEVSIPTANSSQLMLARKYYWKVRLTDGTGKITTPVYGTLIATSPIDR
jgi:hypothetical protein